jgi:hypothetical protein
MSRHNAQVALLHMLDHAREAIELAQTTSRAELDKQPGSAGGSPACGQDARAPTRSDCAL